MTMVTTVEDGGADVPFAKVQPQAVSIVSSRFSEPKVVVYKRRWLILFLFAMVNGCNAFHWIQYCIIANVAMRYYNISAEVVDYTSVVYLITYLPLVLPATYVTRRKGMRFVTVVAALGNCLGSWLKVPSSQPTMFWCGFLGQTVLSCTQLFILGTPSQLAATWFGSDQVSTASSICVFGAQVGISLSFFLTPLVVRDHEDPTRTGDDFFRLHLVLGIVTTAVFLGVLFLFEKEPPNPPSTTQLYVRQSKQEFSNKEFFIGIKSLFTNVPYIMLLLAYGISIGIFNAVSTLMNQVILFYFPGKAVFAGKVGTILVVTGIAGSVMFGYVLDKTRRFKETSFCIYAMTTIGLAGFAVALTTQNEWFVLGSSMVLGLFMSGYLAVGYEMAAELTYPAPESDSSGLLIATAQVSGVIFTVLSGEVVRRISVSWANIAMTACLCVGTIITACTPNVRRRQDALHAQSYNVVGAPILVP